MPTAALTPAPKAQFFAANGTPLVGGKLYSYVAGTTTPLATYINSAGITQNTNPVILDSRGEANVWLTSGVLYKLALYDANDALIWTVDNVSAINDGVFSGPVSGTTGTFSGALIALSGAFSGPVSGTTGTFSGALIAASGTFTTINGDGSGITAVTTAAQFDNDTSPASTAFVQRALGNLAGRATYTTSTNIAAADVGKWIFIPSGTGSISLALPTTVVPNGSRYYVYNNTAASNVTITTTGAITSGTVGALPSVIVGPGQTFDFTTDGVNNWVVSQGDFSRQAAFAGTLVTNGSQRLPSGLIIKYGTTAHAGAAANINQVTTYTTAFPTAVLAVNLTDTNGVNISGVSVSSISSFTASIYNRDPASNVVAATTNWIAIGY
jgi:hypothetical protein